MLGGYRIDPYGGLVDCPFSNMAGNLAMLVEAVPPPHGGGGVSLGCLWPSPSYGNSGSPSVG